jgi:hypothetical protein
MRRWPVASRQTVPYRSAARPPVPTATSAMPLAQKVFVGLVSRLKASVRGNESFSIHWKAMAGEEN